MLVRSKAVTKLTKLGLAYNPIEPPGIFALAETDLPALDELNLADVPCGPAGAKALAGSPYFGNLKSLQLSEEHVGVNGREAVIARSTDKVVSIY